RGLALYRALLRVLPAELRSLSSGSGRHRTHVGRRAGRTGAGRGEAGAHPRAAGSKAAPGACVAMTEAMDPLFGPKATRVPSRTHQRWFGAAIRPQSFS